MRSLFGTRAGALAAVCAATAVVCLAPVQRLPAREPATRPAADVRVWTGDVVADEQASGASGTLRPVSLVGARNGTFSGKVMVESAGIIRGLHASVGAMAGKGGTIPAQNVRLRYGAPWDRQGARWPAGADILLESPPAEALPVRRVWNSPERALAPVWITVRVPKDAKAGTYTGELTVQADGLAPTKVPVSLDVQDWTLPDPQDYRTWLDMIQSPDTLAAEYKVPLWSPKHWDLIGRSFRFISETGSRVLYVPLLVGTNFGNEESMVRWVKKGENQYEYDFTAMDQYLDAAEKDLGKPRLVIFLVWDIYLSLRPVYVGLNLEGGKARDALRGKGPRVTAVDPASGKTETVYLPRYEDPAGKALWQALWAEVRARMERRGLAKALMLGMLSDTWPSKEEVSLLNEVSGGLPWASHAHPNYLADKPAVGNGALYKLADVGYAAHAYNLSFQANPAKGRDYGWRRPQLTAAFPRNGSPNGSCVWLRTLAAINITGGQRGVGRLGADIWPAIRDNKGQRAGTVYSRYPENSARNLDIENWLLAPGPEGPVATARFENLREGVQECEARIFLEGAMLDANQKARVGAELARRCQDLLDEHHRALWKGLGVSDKDLEGQGRVTGKQPIEALWDGLARGEGLRTHDYSLRAVRERMDPAKGQQWFAESGWQERTRRLFALAGEAAGRLAPQRP